MMGKWAQIESLDLLKVLETTLWKFQAAGMAALGDAESELHRTLIWLDVEQDSYWKDQIRKRQESLQRAKEAVRMKKLFRDSAGRPQSAVEEEKALKIAIARLAEAEQKLANVRRWVRALQKEIEAYKGAVQGLGSSLESLVPAAVAHLERLLTDLEAYTALKPESLSSSTAGSSENPRDSVGNPMALQSSATQMPEDATHGITDSATNGTELPTPQQRKDAPSITDVPLTGFLVPAEQLAAIAALPGNRFPSDPQARITIASSSGQVDRLLLTRIAPSSAQDSGWSINVLDASSGAWQSMRVADVQSLRPDWGDLLSLPIGFSVILGMQGIVRVTDSQGRDVWPPAAVG